MIIRKGQMDSLGAQMRKSFEDRMVKHVRRFYPGKAKALGEEKLRVTIREGMAKADRYHVLRERDVARFIQLKYALELEYDEQPEMAWCKEILKNHSLSGEAKMTQIYDELPDRLREIEAEAKASKR